MRRLLQPMNVVNKVPYGNNSKTGRYAQSNDAKIYYEVYGKGKPIVLLHGGLFGSTIEFAQLIDSLKLHYKVIAISTRGHGKSEIGSEPLTLEQRAHDVIAVIDVVTKEKVMIVGFSDGGFTAYNVASLYPDKVERMVVIGAGVLYPGLREFSFNFEKAIQLDTIYWKQQHAIMPQPERLEEVFKQIANCYNKLTVGKELLGSIRCPVLVMAGDRDEGNSVQNVLNAALLISNHQLSIIPNAGHTALNENFDAAWAGISPFLKAN